MRAFCINIKVTKTKFVEHVLETMVDMNKLPMTKEGIERLLIAELQTYPNCRQALQIVVTPIEDHTNPATWTVLCFNHGNSDGRACDRALQHIVPLFQRAYDMVSKH